MVLTGNALKKWRHSRTQPNGRRMSAAFVAEGTGLDRVTIVRMEAQGRKAVRAHKRSLRDVVAFMRDWDAANPEQVQADGAAPTPDAIS